MTYSEKRQFRRAKCEIESTVRNLDSGQLSFWETTANDISEGGLRFRINQFVPVHHRLMVKLHLPKQKAIEAIAQPAWIREVPSLNQYEIGAQFLTMSEEDKATIRDLVGITASPRLAGEGRFA